MFCPSCGAENADNAAFCAKCGTKIDPAAPNPPTSQAAPTPAPARTAIDFLPNAAEGVVKPIVLGALALLAFQFAAFAFGGPNRTTLGNLVGLLVMPVDLILFTALWSGLRRIGSPAAKPASKYAVALAMIVPATALQVGLALIAASAGDKAEAAAGAILLPGLVSAIAGLAAFVSFILFVVAVRKAHDGKLRTFSNVFLVYTIVSMVVAPVLVFAPGAGGCAAVVLHGWLLLSLAKILSAPAPEGEEGFVFKKTPKKLYLCWGFVLALCIGGIALLPADIPAVGGGNPLSGLFGGGGTTESAVRKTAEDLSKELVAKANGTFKSFKDFKKVGPNEWTATVVYKTSGGLERSDMVRIKNNDGYVTVEPENDAEVRESSPSRETHENRKANSDSSETLLNRGREVALAVFSENMERAQMAKAEIWPCAEECMSAEQWFAMVKKAGVKGVDSAKLRGWSIFAPLFSRGDHPFLVSANVKQDRPDLRTKVIPGYLALDSTVQPFGSSVVVVTQDGKVLSGSDATMCLLRAMTGPWKLFPVE